MDYLLSHCVGAGAVSAPWQAKGGVLLAIFERSLQAYPGRLAFS